MRKNKLLLLLALLMTAATGAWAADTYTIAAVMELGSGRSGYLVADAVTLPCTKTVRELSDSHSIMDGLVAKNISVTGDIITKGTGSSWDTQITIGGAGKATISYTLANNDEDVAEVIVKIDVIKTYSVTMKEGAKDAENWTISDGTTNVAGNVGLSGLFEGTEVTLTYSGRLKVKSVTATSDAVPAAAAFAADEYNEASWDDTNKKVVFEKKKATTTPVAVADATTDVTWGDEWYTVSGNVTITGTVTLGADTHLILQDGAKLTINGQLDAYTNRKNLYIYGQRKGDGKLNVICSSDDAINSSAVNRIDIHGGEITAVSTNLRAFVTGILNVYSGKLTATSDGDNGTIQFCSSFDVYGGEVEGTSNATSSDSPSRGISDGGYDKTLTVYGGKVTATGNGREGYGDYGSGINCYVKSGTSGIKFYFSDNGTDWDEGTSYASATSVGGSNDAVATKKRYVKAE